MALATAERTHIRVDRKGRAWIKGTPYKVLDIAIDHVVHGFSPEEIHFQHYGEPSLAQIHAALSYYYDHQAELDGQLEREVRGFEALRAKAGQSPVVKRLRAGGKFALA
ncbi:MAG: DUF433 domain-containing protein [Planctomycetota bacterium]|nr:DUF433 domain-containing protein [Planctomycetota bacterium]